MYVNTTSFTLTHSYMFRPSNSHPQGVLIHFMRYVNQTVSRCEYTITQQRYVAVVKLRVIVIFYPYRTENSL
jgi:hypothetical protein